MPALKLILAVLLIYYVLATQASEAQIEQLANLLRSPSVLVLAIATFSMQLLIGAQRLRILLAPQDITLGYWMALRLTYIGAVFDVFMVTSVGGDAIKAVYLAREVPKNRRLEAVSVLVMDRLMGLLGLLTLVLLMSLLQIETLYADPLIRPHLKWLVLVPGCLLVGTVMLLSKSVYNWGITQYFFKKAPGGRIAERGYGALQLFGDHPKVLFNAWTLSLIVHIFGVVSGYVLMHGLGYKAGFGPFFVAWFISNFICSFAPFGGIGFGQWCYNFIFLKIANMEGGWVLASAVQVTSILSKSPGLLAWLVSREQLNRKDSND